MPRLCINVGCKSRSTYGIFGQPARHCGLHKENNDVNIQSYNKRLRSEQVENNEYVKLVRSDETFLPSIEKLIKEKNRKVLMKVLSIEMLHNIPISNVAEIYNIVGNKNLFRID